MDVRLLGPLEVRLGGRRLDLGPHKQRVLLAVLALAAPAVVTTDRLLEDLWGEEAFGKHNALWIHVSRLRAALEPDRDPGAPSGVLVTHDHGYSLAIDPHDVDVNRFEDDVARGVGLVEDDPAEAHRVLTRALRSWRGRPLEDLAYEEFAQPTIRRLEELRLRAVAARFDAALLLGAADDLLPEIADVRRDHPLDERFVVHDVLALYRSGRAAEALGVIAAYRQLLADELGLEASPELHRLEQQVLRHDDTLQGDPGHLDGPRADVAGQVGEDTLREAALRTDAAEWERSGRDEDYLLTGEHLAEHRRWAATTTLRLDPALHAYLDASTRAEDSRRGDAIASAAARQRARVARRQRWVVTAVLLSVAAVALGVVHTGGPPRVGAIHAPYEGALHLQFDEGVEQAARELDIETELLAPVTDAAGQVERYLATDPDFVVLDASLEWVAGVPLQPLVDRHPDVRFAVTAMVGAVPPDLDGDNVQAVDYASEEGAFLAGAVAALETRTGIVGFVGAAPWAADDVRAGFEAGVRHVDPSVRVLSTHLVAAPFDVFLSPAAGRTAATRLFDEGADVVMHAAGESVAGVLQAATDGSDRLGRHLWVVGFDVDEWLLAAPADRGHVLTSVLVRHDIGVLTAIERHLAGDHGDVVMDVGNGGLALSRSGGHLSAATAAVVDELADAITAGRITVPVQPVAPPTDPPAATVEATLAAATDACVASGLPLVVDEQDTVTVTATNGTSRPVRVGLWPLGSGATASSGAAAGSAPTSTPWTSADVAPGGSNALTFRLTPLDLTAGEWALWCTDPSDGSGARTRPFTVAGPAG